MGCVNPYVHLISVWGETTAVVLVSGVEVCYKRALVLEDAAEGRAQFPNYWLFPRAQCLQS